MSIQLIEWLMGNRLLTLTRQENSWMFTFDRQVLVQTEGLWRFFEDGHLYITSDDDGHQFGLPARVDVAHLANDRLAGASVTEVSLRAASLDLGIHFATGHVVEFVAFSGGYESWMISHGPGIYVACGGARLAHYAGGQTHSPTTDRISNDQRSDSIHNSTQCPQ